MKNFNYCDVFVLDGSLDPKKKKKKKKIFNLDDLDGALPDKDENAINDGAQEETTNLEDDFLDMDFSKTKKKKKKKKDFDELVAEEEKEKTEEKENGKYFYFFFLLVLEAILSQKSIFKQHAAMRWKTIQILVRLFNQS